MSHTVLSGTYFSQLSDFLNILKLRFSSDFSFSDYRGQCYFCEKQTEDPAWTKAWRQVQFLPSVMQEDITNAYCDFLFIDSLNTAPGAKSPNVIHILTTKSLLEKTITSTIFIEQEIQEIFLALDPRTEVQNKADARYIHQLCCEAFPMHCSILFNWNDWQHFDRSKACSWRV